AGRAEQDVQGARADLGGDSLVGDADGEVVEVVAVEVAGGEGEAEAVEFLRRAEDQAASPALVEELVDGRQAAGAAVEDLHGAGRGDAVDRLPRNADRQVVVAVVVEVADGERLAEAVVL